MLGAKIVTLNDADNSVGSFTVNIIRSILNCGIFLVRASIVGLVCCLWGSTGVENLRLCADPDSFEGHSMVIFVDSDGFDISRRLWVNSDVKVSLFFLLENRMDDVLILA